MADLSKSSTSNEDSLTEGSISLTKKGKKKKPKVPKKVFPEIEWTLERPKPTFVPNTWKPEIEEELVHYIDWHRRHPHCISPRPIPKGESLIGGQRYDEDDNTKYYIRSQIKDDPVTDPLYFPKELGEDGEISVVTEKAARKERTDYLKLYGETPDDPWYEMSVKDQLETSHIDGDHTTVRRKQKKKKELSDAQKDVEKRKLAFQNYSGGNMPVTNAQSKMIEIASMGDKALLHGSKDKLNPWDERRVFTRYTETGTFKDRFKLSELARNVKLALEIYYKDMEQQELAAKAQRKRLAKERKQMRASESKKQSSVGAHTTATFDSTIGTIEAYESMAEMPGGGTEMEMIVSESLGITYDGSLPSGAAVDAEIKQKTSSTDMMLINLDTHPDHDPAFNPESESPIESKVGDSQTNSHGHSHSQSAPKSMATSTYLPVPSVTYTNATDSRSNPSTYRDNTARPSTSSSVSSGIANGEDEDDSESQMHQAYRYLFGIHRKFKPRKVDPDNYIDDFDTMKAMMGGDDVAEKMTSQWIALNKEVNKKTKKKKALVNLDIDINEACDKLRIIKVRYLLMKGYAGANDVNEQEQPLFLYIFIKACQTDMLTGNVEVGDHTKDTSDRKKMQKLLTVLIQYKADINKPGREALSAVHIAAKTRNSKMLFWLIQNGAEINQCSSKELMTPLMYGAKYAYVHVLAALIKHGVPIDLQNEEGNTALHFAAMYGQTRIAQFLLRLGASKFIANNAGFVAAKVAFEGGHQACAQGIAAFARPKPDVPYQLQYIVDKEEAKLQANQSIGKRLSLLNGSAADKMNAFALEAKERMQAAQKDFYKKVRRVLALMSGYTQDELDMLEACAGDAVEMDEDGEDCFGKVTVKTDEEIEKEKNALEGEDDDEMALGVGGYGDLEDEDDVQDF